MKRGINKKLDGWAASKKVRVAQSFGFSWGSFDKSIKAWKHNEVKK